MANELPPIPQKSSTFNVDNLFTPGDESISFTPANEPDPFMLGGTEVAMAGDDAEDGVLSTLPPSDAFGGKTPSQPFVPPTQQFAPTEQQSVQPSQQFAPTTQPFVPPAQQFAPTAQPFVPPAQQFAPTAQPFVPPAQQFNQAMNPALYAGSMPPSSFEAPASNTAAYVPVFRKLGDDGEGQYLIPYIEPAPGQNILCALAGSEDVEVRYHKFRLPGIRNVACTRGMCCKLDSKGSPPSRYLVAVIVFATDAKGLPLLPYDPKIGVIQFSSMNYQALKAIKAYGNDMMNYLYGIASTDYVFRSKSITAVGNLREDMFSVVEAARRRYEAIKEHIADPFAIKYFQNQDELAGLVHHGRMLSMQTQQTQQTPQQFAHPYQQQYK